MTQAFVSQIDGRDNTNVTVQLDGRVLGYATPALAKSLALLLRRLKTQGDPRVPLDLEIGHVPVSKGGQYPGLYLFGDRSRMMRPVTYLENGRTDSVGSFEQVYMDIACTKEEIDKASTHVELDPTSMLSVIANMTPFSDFNQSPRNMYQVSHMPGGKLTCQCQMGKQTMGTPSTAIAKRTDNKMVSALVCTRLTVSTDCNPVKLLLSDLPCGTTMGSTISPTGRMRSSRLYRTRVTIWRMP